MERVVNNDMQPVVLEDGTMLPASGTPEAGPREVTLSEKDRLRYVETGRVAMLKPPAQQPSKAAPPPPPPSTQDVSGKKERS